MTDVQRKISVLIVDDGAEIRTNLTKLLQQLEPDIDVVGVASNGHDAIARVMESRPDVVVIDVNLPDVDGISATQSITRDVPGTGVVMVSMHGGTDYLRRAMHAGARQFLVKPFSGQELAAAIRQVEALEAPRRGLVPSSAPGAAASPLRTTSGKVLVAFSPKGGVGCTTIAVNLAVALRQKTNKRVALVDASLRFGDVALMLNLHDTKTIADLAPLAADLDEDLLLGMMATHPSGVQVLAAPTRPEMAEVVTPELMRRVLALLRLNFDFVLVDTWASFDETVLSSLDAADQILLIMTMEMPCIKNTRLFLEVADALRYPVEKISLVVNRFTKDQSISIQDVEKSVRRRVAHTVALDSRLVTQAVNTGVPFVVSNPDTVVARDLLGMASVVAGAGAPSPTNAHPSPSARTRRGLGSGLTFLGKRG